MAKTTILSPVAEPRTVAMMIPALPPELGGLTVGFLDNTKHNFDRLVEGVGRVLKERFGVRQVVHSRKANASTPAPQEMIEAMAKECDLVFAGSAD